jgi:hypothetical protein
MTQAASDAASGPQEADPVQWTPSARAAVLACAAVGLLLRLFFLSADALTEEEARTWGRLAAGVRDGNGLLEWRAVLAAPLYAFAPAFGLAPETVLRGGAALAGGLGVVAAALLARRLSGPLAGIFAAALFAVAPALLGVDRAGSHLPLVAALALALCLCAAEVDARGSSARGSPEALQGALWLAGAAACGVGLGLSGRWAALSLLFPAALVLSSGGLPAGPLAALRSALPVPLAGAAAGYLLGQRLFGPLEAPCEYTFRGVLYSEYGEGPSALLHLALAAVKSGPGTLGLAAAGVYLGLQGGEGGPPAARRERCTRLLLGWFALVALVRYLSHPLWPEESALLLPPVYLLAAAGAAALVERLRQADGAPTRRSIAALALCALAGPGWEAFASASVAPHPRLWLSPLAALRPLGDRPPLLAWSPTSEIGTTGLREAAQVVAARAEPSAEVASSQPEALLLLFAAAGRDDLSQKGLVRGVPCRSGRVCYVILQDGRLGTHACEAANWLAKRPAWHEERVLGLPLVRVYRLAPGESPYPDECEPHR